MGCFGSRRPRPAGGMPAPTPPAPTPAAPAPPAPKLNPYAVDYRGWNPLVNRPPKDTIFSDPDRGIWVGYLSDEKPRPGPWTRLG